LKSATVGGPPPYSLPALQNALVRDAVVDVHALADHRRRRRAHRVVADQRHRVRAAGRDDDDLGLAVEVEVADRVDSR
jgi:hypothetical protein